ncbi:MAG: flagellar motor protein MotB [Stellaceae bacterium]
MRRPPEQKAPNHERWVISYADFTTLLLATFVVMYAVSSVNSSKFQQMAEAFSTAFIGKVVTIQTSGLAAAKKAPFDNMPSPVHTPVITRDTQVKHLPPALRQRVEQQALKLNEAYEKLTQLLAGMISRGEVRVSLQPLGVVIDIKAVVLFNSAKAELTPGALQLIEQVASVLKELDYRIQVNGFTDNAQIHSAQFSSNWDLSAARAISVVKRFVLDGINPSLLVGAGYGEYHPVASNATPDGMAMNRRVSIVVVSPVGDQDVLHTPLLGEGPERIDAAENGEQNSGDLHGSVPQHEPPQPDACGNAPANGAPC